MKTVLLLLSLLIVQFSFGQKAPKIKFKGNNYRYTMMALPESALPYSYKTFDLKIEDNDVNYSYSWATTTKEPYDFVFSIAGKSLNTKNPDLLLKIEGLDYFEKEEETSSYSKTVGEKTYTYYNYSQNVEKRFLFTVKDAKTDELLYTDTMVFETKYEFPKDFMNNMGNKNKKDLKSQYLSYKKNMYDSGKAKLFEDTKNRAIVLNSSESFKKRINELVGFKKGPGFLVFYLPKTKDDRFDELYEILDVFKHGNDLMKENRSQGIVNNFHAQNTYENFNDAYTRLMKYDLAKCIELTENEELGNEMFVNLKIPKLTAMIFTSRYEEAFKIFEEYKPKDASTESQGEVVDGLKNVWKELRFNPFDAPKTIKPSLFALWGLYKVEVQFYERFSKAYNYYK